MSTAAAPSTIRPSANKPYLAAKLLLTAAVVGIALTFVLHYVFRYYLHYSESAFTDPARGAANYWRMRGWLLLHMSGGMVAILTGPWQFWTGFRNRFARLHRFTGRVYLIAVALGITGAVRMAISTTFGWAFGVGLVGLALAWFTTSGMAYYAILQRRIPVHKEWMLRSYIVTFAFVTFRVFNDYGPLSRLEPAGDRSSMLIWACWSVPLLLTEVILQLRRMSSPGPRL